MGFVDFLGLGRSRLRPIQLGRLCSRPKPRREALQLEALEVRVVLATTTFAQFIHIGESPQVFAYTNNDGASQFEYPSWRGRHSVVVRSAICSRLDGTTHRPFVPE